MDVQIAQILAQDGLVNGAIYGLMALALVLVFSVTRVIFVPQGELVAFAALTMAALQSGGPVRLLWLIGALALAVLMVEAVRHQRGGDVAWGPTLLWTVWMPAAGALLVWVRPDAMPLQLLTVLLLITPLGPLLYRLVYRPIADAPVLLLLIVSVALHGVLMGLGLLAFGAEGSRTPPLSDMTFEINGQMIQGHAIVVVAVTAALVVLMAIFFGRTLLGKALMATAHNRLGARLMGIPTGLCGDISFATSALIGAVSGLLIAPITTVYYDTGFLIGLKGFVAAIVGGISSYPVALLGALLVGQLESFSSFVASAYKEVIVFTLIIPVLWWRSLRTHHVEDGE